MTYKFGKKSYLEVLEARIAPASAAGHVGQDIISAVVNSATYLTAGETLSTQANGGNYLMYVESGSALVFSTDLNKNGVVDSNEITGIAAGANLSLISFVDIHGDIVTDLKSNGTLTDSGTNSNSNPSFGGDGGMLLANSIAKIELRSLNVSDLVTGSTTTDVLNHLSISSYSIFGNIFAGAGFGTADGNGGLIIDTTGAALQSQKFVPAASNSFYQASTPSIGSIYVGTAASNKSFSFGASDLVAGTVGTTGALGVGGKITNFTPAAGKAGGSIVGVSAVGNISFNLDGLYAGDGGTNTLGKIGGAGGNISNVTLGGDQAGGYTIKAGNGGAGGNGGQGGLVANFSDLGTSTGRVLIGTGDGGEGLGKAAGFGIGGNGGKATFGTMNIFGNVKIKLGDGGDGYHFGGSGRSLPSLNLTTGESNKTGATALQVVSTWHDPTGANGTNLGRLTPIDFNDDGISDFAFTSASPNQLTVEISHVIEGITYFDRIDLAVSGTPGSLTAGDFNGDGIPDLAVAYSDTGGTAGISIYSGKMQGGEFVFGVAQSSALPQLLTYGNSSQSNSGSQFVITGQPVTSMVSGDFNHDGKTDLALSAIYTARGPAIGETVERDIIMYLQGDGSGKVFANFANGAVPFINVQVHSDTSYIQLQAAGVAQLGTGATVGNDVLFYGVTGAKVIHEVDFSMPTFVNTVISLGQVDTSRKVFDDQGNPVIALQDSTLLNFTIGDFDNDGKSDLAVLTKQPTGYLVTLKGDGTGAYSIASGSGNNGGILLASSNPDDNPVILSDNFQVAALSVTSNDGTGTKLGVYGTVSTLNGNSAEVYTVALSQGDTVKGVSGGPLDQGKLVNPDSETLGFGVVAPDNTNSASPFDTYLGDGSAIGYVGLLNGNENSRISPSVAFSSGNFVPMGLTGVVLEAGAGGNSSNGVGGNGGSIGGLVLGAVSIDGSGIADSINTSLGINFLAGRGGNGYLAGGSGGALDGLKVTYSSSTYILGTTLTAGDGGNSETAKGGAGGSVFNNNIIGGTLFAGGDGGSGKNGGIGGSVLGKGDQTVFDTSGGGVVVYGGRGGDGDVNGGMGGSVTNFVNSLYLITLDGLVSYSGGDGGAGGTGTGGAGGSVLKSSPTASNGFGGEFFLKGGDGGLGKIGGNGGKVQGFTNSSQEGNPTLFTALGGDGGFATGGKGGKGGNVVNVSGSGAAFDSTTSTLQADLILAGAGGASATANGGNGGSIINVSMAAAGGAVVISGGVGGDGGKNGGLGGSVTTVLAAATQISTGGGGVSVAKVLITAGAGGTGGTAGNGGIGGLGGSILGVKQKGNFLTNIDLIAGNGGSVVSGDETTSKVGKGGSITNINLAGTIGDNSAGQPITSYGATADLLARLRDAAIGHNDDPIGTAAAQLTNADGNVGLVAGAAGTLNGQVVAGAKNGSVTNITARAIMSMVAGNVDNLAAIQKLTNVHLTVSTGVLGADKGTAGQRDYLDQNGAPIDHPVIGGQLVDGAIFSINVLKNNDGTKTPTSDRVFTPFS